MQKRYVLHTSTPVVRLMLRIECLTSSSNHQSSRLCICIFAHLWFLYDVCTVHVYSIPCFPEILFLISCRLASIVAYKKMLNRNSIVWKDWNPVSWTSNSQVSILNPAFNWKVCEIPRVFSYQNEQHAPVGLLFARLVLVSHVGICWNVDAIPGNDGTRVLGWSRKAANRFCEW